MNVFLHVMHCFYMMCMWFHGWIEVWEGMWMSFNCFSNWAKRFLQGVQLNCPQGVRWQKGSIRVSFCSHSSQECMGTVLCKECAGQAKSQSCDFEQKGLKDFYCRSVQGRRLQHLVVVEGFPQGVRAKGFLRRLKFMKNSGGISLWTCWEIAQTSCVTEVGKKHRKVTHSGTSLEGGDSIISGIS